MFKHTELASVRANLTGTAKNCTIQSFAISGDGSRQNIPRSETILPPVINHGLLMFAGKSPIDLTQNIPRSETILPPVINHGLLMFAGKSPIDLTMTLP